MAVLWQQNESGLRLPAGAAGRARRLLLRAARLTKRRFAEVGLTYVTPHTSRSLNKRYRRHPWVTDVLSFTYQAQPVSGEIVICLAQAARQAKRRGHTLARELEVLVCHGLLHLAGYDHIRAKDRLVMRALEDKLLKV